MGVCVGAPGVRSRGSRVHGPRGGNVPGHRDSRARTNRPRRRVFVGGAAMLHRRRDNKHRTATTGVNCARQSSTGPASANIGNQVRIPTSQKRNVRAWLVRVSGHGPAGQGRVWRSHTSAPHFGKCAPRGCRDAPERMSTGEGKKASVPSPESLPFPDEAYTSLYTKSMFIRATSCTRAPHPSDIFTIRAEGSSAQHGWIDKA